MKKITTNIKKNIYFKEEIINALKYEKGYEWNIIRFYEKMPKQTWYGMGGSFTEASCYNIKRLPENKQKEVLSAYFDESGLNYNLGRVSIASNDFCLDSYEYTKKNDLSDFNIERDKLYILPILKEVLRKKKLSLLASPWSPPAFMKENNDLYHGDKLKKENYKLFGKYLKKFIEAYQKENIKITYITLQNEPNASQIWESCKYSLEELRKLANFVEKEFTKQDPKIFIWDHNKDNLVEVCQKLINKKTKGVAYHSYLGTHSKNLELATQIYPNLLFFHTEGCTNFTPYNKNDWILDAEIYLIDLLEDINNGMNGYIDWNLVLDYNGGPNHKNNFCKSPIILNKEKTDFIKTPIYHYLLHISKIKVKSKILPLDIYRPDLFGVAIKNNKEYQVILLNPNSYDIDINLIIENKRIEDKIEAHSIVTYLS